MDDDPQGNPFAPMERLGDTLAALQAAGELGGSIQTKNAPAALPNSRPPPPFPAPSTTCPPLLSRCPRCDDAGLVSAAAEDATHDGLVITARYGGDRVLAVCPQCPAGAERAWAWSGLPDEARGVRLDGGLKVIAMQQEAIWAIQALLRDPRGWLTLGGGYGVGKTLLIYAALNHLADAGVYGRYTTAPDLLDWLREGIGDTLSPGGRMRQLLEAPALAIDELDKYNATAFAEEKMFQLFRARYEQRATHVTLIGYNLDGVERIPPFLRSRISDGRFRLVQMRGSDLRPALTGPLNPWDRGEGE